MSINLTNSWMNDPTFLAQSAHFFSAIAVIMTAYHFWGKVGALIVAGLFVAAAAVKEYWYDAKYELPPQSFWDNTLDFAFYFAGSLLSTIILLLGN